MTFLHRPPPAVAYDVKAILRPSTGRAYVGFTCTSCSRDIAMLNDADTAAIAAARVATVEVRCPTCRSHGAYSTTDLKRFVAS